MGLAAVAAPAAEGCATHIPALSGADRARVGRIEAKDHRRAAPATAMPTGAPSASLDRPLGGRDEVGGARSVQPCHAAMLDDGDTATCNSTRKAERVLGRVDGAVRLADHSVGEGVRSDDRAEFITFDDGCLEAEVRLRRS